MKIDVVNYEKNKYDAEIAESAVIIIDVLRCTSAIINAFNNGCIKALPFVEPQEAIDYANAVGRSGCVIGGERGCNIVPGFDVGNSPFEYGPERVGGMTVVFSTSNGSNAICGVAGGKHVYLGALSNRTAAVKKACSTGDDLLIVCSGTNGRISADDCCAAGSMIAVILEQDPACELSDFAMICLELYKSLDSGSFDLTKTYHCGRLIKLGYGRDVEYCLTEDSTALVPEYKDGEIILG